MKLVERFIVVFLVLFCFYGKVNATEEVIMSLENKDAICNDIKSADFGIHIVRFNANGVEDRTKIIPDTNSCTNDNYYNENLSGQFDSSTTSLATPWTWFGPYTGTNIEVEGKKLTGDSIKNYQYFKIANRSFKLNSKTNKLYKEYTLGSRDTLLLRKKLESNIDLSQYDDIRLVFEYGVAEGSLEINIYSKNSMAAYWFDSDLYLLSSKKVKISNQELVDVSFVGESTKILKYRAISGNLKEGQSGLARYIALRPYEYYNLHYGELRLYSMKLVGYKNETYKEPNSDKIANMADVNETGSDKFNNKVRHNIVNNMVDLATVKWGMRSDNPTLYFFHGYNTFPIKFGFDSNNKNFHNEVNYTNNLPNSYTEINTALYGLPYVNTNAAVATVNTFLSRTNLYNGTYRYKLPNKYAEDTTAYNGNNLAIGADIGNELYLHEGIDVNSNTLKINELERSDRNYIHNSYNYLLGSDCAKSTYISLAQEVPSYARDNKYKARDYYASADVKPLGGIYLSYADVYKKLIAKNTDLKDTQFTEDLHTNYYSSVYKEMFSKDNILKGYALLYPGDFIASRGHVRIITGRTHVQCNNGEYTENYQGGYCNNRGGIDDEASYVVATDITVYYKLRNNYRIVSDDNWKLTFGTFNEDYSKGITDIKSLNEFSNKYSAFIINGKYPFKILYGCYQEYTNGPYICPNATDENGKYREIREHKLYLPFRYTIMNEVDNDKYFKRDLKIKSNDNSNIKTDKYLRGIVTSNYIIDGVKYIIKNQGKEDKIIYEYPIINNHYSFYHNMQKKAKDDIKAIDYTKPYYIEVRMNTGPSTFETNLMDEDGFVTVYTLNNGYVLPTALTLNKTSATIEKGSTLTLTPTISPTDVTDKTVKWTSSDTTVATVDSSGKVTAKKAGTAIITARTHNNRAATCTVTVSVSAASITLNKTSATIEKGSTLTLTPTISPADVTDKTVKWTSSDTTVATVDSSGKVTAKKAGTAIITASTHNNRTATCTVTVSVSAASITLNKTSATIEKGSTLTLTPTISPADVTDKTVKWTSSDTTVATVDSSGKVTAKKAGTAIITARTSNGKEAKILITVDSFKEPIFTNTSSFISDTGKIIYRLNVNLNLRDFINKVINNETVKIYDEKNNLKTAGNIVTGDRVTFMNKDKQEDYYDLSVAGDLNADGKITPLDYVKIKNHIMEENIITKKPFILAADYNNDNRITPLDYVGIKNYIMKGEN